DRQPPQHGIATRVEVGPIHFPLHVFQEIIELYAASVFLYSWKGFLDLLQLRRWKRERHSGVLGIRLWQFIELLRDELPLPGLDSRGILRPTPVDVICRYRFLPKPAQAKILESTFRLFNGFTRKRPLRKLRRRRWVLV